MKKVFALLTAISLCSALAACGPAQAPVDAGFPALIPLPNDKVEMGDGRFILPQLLGVDPGGFPMEYFEIYAQRAGVALIEARLATLRASRDETLPPEGYHLRVTQEHIEIEAADEQGLCWALTTLAALTEDQSVPDCDIEDAPHYAYRGFMMDSARNFFPVETIKTLIELTSMVKMNVFHWHLTDDQGWRVESKRFPALQEQNLTPGEYYTQDEIRDVIEFARLRGVEVIPEIDVPGHATAIMAAYPELSCSGKPVSVAPHAGIRRVILCGGKDEVFELLFPLLEEMAELFPSKYIHLGGDEAPKDEWGKCPHCRRRVEEEGLANLEELQGWFTARLAGYLRGLGKQIICWNESLLSERLPEEVEDLTIQYWAEARRVGPARRFWERGGSMIFSDEFGAYLDLPHGATTLKKVYNYKPAVIGFQGKGLPALGIEAGQWTEFISTEEKLGLMTFPRAYASAEAAWTQPDSKDYREFRRRLNLWLEKYPGMGFTPPEEADPNLFARYKENIAFLRHLSTFLDKDYPDNAGVGGRLDIRYGLRWVKNYFF